MSRTVVVLCPNARREIVKLTPNSSILQVLEEACQKQNLNPEDYDLRHSNKILDLSLPIRFSNLPNNAQVELRPAEKARKDSLVTVCVQLEAGERLTADFPPSATVYDVVEKCLKTGSIAMQDVGEPVCIYMRQKITGDSIKTTTLRSLGLTKGQAIIRLLYRKPEELEEQAHVSSPLVAHPVQQNLMPQQRECKQPDLSVPEHMKDQSHPDSSTDGFKPIEIEVKPTGLKEASPSLNYSNWDSAPIKEEKTVGMGETSHTDYGYWGSAPIKEEKTAGIGETSHTDYGYWDSVPIKETDNVGISKTSPPVQYSNWDSIAVEEEKYIHTEVEMECDTESLEEDTFQGVGDIKYIGERHAVVYNLDDITNIKKADLPDEFFDVTVSDVRYLMQEYKKERSELENQPLLTKEQRQRNIVQKLAKYNQTVIRVYFPERLVLQAVFTSVETVQTILDFIRNYLQDKNLKFYLYITPPKEILNPSKTVLEAMLVPAAVVYFGCESPQPNYLRVSLRDQLSDPRAASLAASESRKSSTTNIPVNIPNENIFKEEKLEDANPVVNTVSHSGKPSNPEKVPKWLKLSRK